MWIIHLNTIKKEILKIFFFILIFKGLKKALYKEFKIWQNHQPNTFVIFA